MQNSIAVLYSKEQKCWHLETLMEYLLSNQRFLLDVTKVQQYRFVCLFNSWDEAKDFVGKNRDMFKVELDFKKDIERIVVYNKELFRNDRLIRICEYILLKLNELNYDLHLIHSLSEHEGEFSLSLEETLYHSDISDVENVFKEMLESENEYSYQIVCNYNNQ
jgi:hypothetical protein